MIGRRFLALAGVALLVGAHGASARLAGNTLAGNKLAGNTLAATKLSASKLATAKLAGNQFALDPASAGDLLATEDGREVLSFIVSCAMPNGVTLTGTGPDSTVYEFLGDLGLAKSWLRKPLSNAGKGWISACLLARVNDAGVPVAVSLRGAHRALATSPEEEAAWTLEEGAFYGNLFVLDTEPAVAVACRGKDQAAGETGGLISRDCAEPEPSDPAQTLCGFTYAGDCGDFAPTPACRAFSRRGFYKGCADSPSGATRFRQVITTFAIP